MSCRDWCWAGAEAARVLTYADLPRPQRLLADPRTLHWPTVVSPQNPDFLEKIRAPLHCITFRSCRQLYRLDQLVLPVARQTKHLSRPLPVFLVAIARENTFVCVDHLQQARADTSDAKHESKPKCISYTQHSDQCLQPFYFASAGSA